MAALFILAFVDACVWYRYRKGGLPVRIVAEPHCLGPLFYGLACAWIESAYVSPFIDMSTLAYRSVFVLVMCSPFANRDPKIWIADSLLALTSEDVGFWVFKGWLPGPWAWYYPTVFHVPLLDLLAIPSIVLLYRASKLRHQVSRDDATVSPVAS